MLQRIAFFFLPFPPCRAATCRLVSCACMRTCVLCCPAFCFFFLLVWVLVWFSCFTGSIQLLLCCLTFYFNRPTCVGSFFFSLLPPSTIPLCRDAIKKKKRCRCILKNSDRRVGVWLVNAKTKPNQTTLDAVCVTAKPRTSISIGQQKLAAYSFFFPFIPLFFFPSFQVKVLVK